MPRRRLGSLSLFITTAWARATRDVARERWRRCRVEGSSAVTSTFRISQSAHAVQFTSLQFIQFTPLHAVHFSSVRRITLQPLTAENSFGCVRSASMTSTATRKTA